MALDYQTIEIEGKTYVPLEKGKIPVIDDAKPEGENVLMLDPLHLNSKVHTVNEEAKKWRLQKEELEKKLAPFDGFDLEMQKEKDEVFDKYKRGEFNTQDTAVIEKSVADRLNATWKRDFDALNKNHEEKIKGYESQVTRMETYLYDQILSGMISNSPLFNGEDRITYASNNLVKTSLTPFFERTKDVDGNLELKAVYNGEPIISRSNPGTPPSLEEIFDFLSEKSADIRSLIKPSSGGGSNGNNGNVGRRANAQDYYNNAAKSKDVGGMIRSKLVMQQ